MTPSGTAKNCWAPVNEKRFSVAARAPGGPTSQARHIADNLGAGRGSLPDEATRKKMVELVEGLPEPELEQDAA